MPLNLVDCEPVLHDRHLCALAERRQMYTLALLAKDGKYFCSLCGRVAAKTENVCGPVELSQIELKPQ